MVYLDTYEFKIVKYWQDYTKRIFHKCICIRGTWIRKYSYLLKQLLITFDAMYGKSNLKKVMTIKCHHLE